MESFPVGEQALVEFLHARGVEVASLPAELVPDLSRGDMSYGFIWGWCRAAKLFGRSLKLTQVLCCLLRRNDHQGHEDIADSLQDLRDPQSVDCLFDRAVRPLTYLDYNESAALARKCVWALYDIGTPQAVAKLNLLAGDGRGEVSKEATDRLAALARRRPGDADEPYRIARSRQLGTL